MRKASCAGPRFPPPPPISSQIQIPTKPRESWWKRFRAEAYTRTGSLWCCDPSAGSSPSAELVFVVKTSRTARASFVERVPLQLSDASKVPVRIPIFKPVHPVFVVRTADKRSRSWKIIVPIHCSKGRRRKYGQLRRKPKRKWVSNKRGEKDGQDILPHGRRISCRNE